VLTNSNQDPLEVKFLYLAVVLVTFSRRMIGSSLGRSLEDELTMTALRIALQERRPAPMRVVHHSERVVCMARRTRRIY
jgi:putative transposase